MEDLATLIEKATKGDQESLTGLFSRAQAAEAAGKRDEAVGLYKEAATCYRISAFRERAHKEAAELGAASGARTFEFICEMLERTALVPPLRIKANDAEQAKIWECVASDLYRLPNMDDAVNLLRDQLENEVHTNMKRKLAELFWTLYSGYPAKPANAFWQRKALVRLVVLYLSAELEGRMGLQIDPGNARPLWAAEGHE